MTNSPLPSPEPVDKSHSHMDPAFLSIDDLRSCASINDHGTASRLMHEACRANDKRVTAYAAERAWRVACSYIREGDESRAVFVISSMPESFLNEHSGHFKNDALFLAAKSGMQKTSLLLMHHQADPSLPGAHRRNALMQFALMGDVSLTDIALRQIAKKSPRDADKALSITDANGSPISFFAVASNANPNNKAAILELLRDHGWVFGRPYGKEGYTELHLASSLGDCPSITNLITSCAIDPNIPSRTHHSPLMVAAHAGSADAARTLLALGANPDLQSVNTGLTAAHIAASHGHVDFLRQLHQCNANLRISRTINSQTPADVARQCGHSAAASFVDNPQVVATHHMADLAGRWRNKVLLPVTKAARHFAGIGR